ncbi:MAG: single-stranded DNA-binding protein [Ardenticatenaceae bacterium]|nr:single-stranded DNA-binding protein [Ardenticatenaceae bacterium]MCB8990684.1 single-stranded DNA-binding protein [Ardenticatenaceae bacterium]MCB9004055.1 single-stranded DNA-binding protein [Ardenticatenaceae bacterium]
MYQKIIIVGNLGRDPEMRYMPDGTAVTSFSVATNRRWTDRATGQPVDETTWFRVSVWGRQAETANQYLSRGRKVLVEGVITPDRNTGGPRLWTAQDGTVRASFEVRADSVRFIGGRDEGGYDGDGGYEDAGGAAQEEDEIPF